MSRQARRPASPKVIDRTDRTRPDFIDHPKVGVNLPAKPPKSARGASNRPPRKDEPGA